MSDMSWILHLFNSKTCQTEDCTMKEEEGEGSVPFVEGFSFWARALGHLGQGHI